MAIYRASAAAKAGVNTANTVMWQLTTSSTARLRIKEIIWTVSTAPTTAPQIVVARPATLGTSSATQTPQLNDPAEPASTAIFQTAWSVAPTYTTAGPFLLTATLPTTAGSTFYWVSPSPDQDLIVPVSSGLQFIQHSASGASVGAHSLTVAWQE
jgi:hypothetical protein